MLEITDLKMSQTMKKIFLIGLLVILMPLSVIAATINVPTSEHTTIQAGIDVAVDGGIVLLADGTYRPRQLQH